MFRGILLPWMIGARERNLSGLHANPPGAFVDRPLIVMVHRGLYAAASGKAGPDRLRGRFIVGVGNLLGGSAAW